MARMRAVEITYLIPVDEDDEQDDDLVLEQAQDRMAELICDEGVEGGVILTCTSDDPTNHTLANAFAGPCPIHEGSA